MARAGRRSRNYTRRPAKREPGACIRIVTYRHSIPGLDDYLQSLIRDSERFLKDDEWWVLADAGFSLERAEIETLSEATRLAENNGVNLLIDNPSFEYWVLLHVCYMARRFDDAEKLMTCIEEQFEALNCEIISSSVLKRLGNAMVNAATLRVRAEEESGCGYPSVEFDKHANNHGFLRDNATGLIYAIAPLFDHNYSLFPYDMPYNYDEWRSGERPRTYDACRPRLTDANRYMTFDEQATYVLGHSQREKLRRLLGPGVRFHNVEGREAVPEDRLNAWQDFITIRANQLLSMKTADDREIQSILNSRSISREDLPAVRLGLI